MELLCRAVDCDVLVVGGGAAGLTAAIEARARGASVMVAAKQKAGRSGNTVVAGGGFAAVVPFEGSEDSSDLHFRDSLESGEGLNDERLLRLLVDQAGSQALKLEDWGVRLQRLEGKLARRAPGGHSRPRNLNADSAHLPAALGGFAVLLPLRTTAERMGVRFLNDTPILQLSLHDGEVCGAVAIDLEDDRLLQIRARAVVMAAGGGGQLYANTNNVRGISGDSYALMLEAGATLRDMEFVQFFPSQITTPFRALAHSALFSDGAVLRNRHGERFMPLYDPVKGDRTTRDRMAQGIFYEIQKGNGIDGEVYMDCTAVPEEALRTKYSALRRDLSRHGVDMAKDWLKVAPSVHFFMGGVEIDERCRTGVPGLFAAGEAVGGVHGANRLGGNALSEAVVFGPIAGQSATEHAAKGGALHRVSTPAGLLDGTGEGCDSLEPVRRDLRRAMWTGASIVRSRSSLEAVLSTVRECARGVVIRLTSASDLARREETRLMCLAAGAVVLSALAREESRGAHFREDFPSREDRWLGSNNVRLMGGKLRIEFRPKESAGRG